MTESEAAGGQSATSQSSGATSSSKGKMIGGWVTAVVAAGVLVMSGVMKLAMYDAEGGPHVIAEKLGWSKGMMSGLGAVELVAAVLLLIPKTSPVGGILASLLMVGALGAHATKLGFGGDMMGLWPLAVVVLVTAVATIVLRKERLPIVGKRA